ncbi:hypothetical protein FB45DRAFT_838606 [Roridomyces roridus]|uniref:Oxidase ustYa n=1 Tax=Roridomyces roridus TaxID=1738132 RepID=A0AAD7FGE6_9AGAR|nr:hypothetical protein FB45DRAFT_838606 [Roridomyces roridus]
MSIYEPVRFSLDPSDTLANDSEWATLGENPKGFGRTRLGPEYRVFLPTFYHQLHCVRRAQIAFLGTATNDTRARTSNLHHFAHCLNYLRQTLLCQAADGLEEGDFMRTEWSAQGPRDSLVCDDWKKVHDVMDGAYDDWLEWKKQWA